MAEYTENDYKGVSLRMEDVFISPDQIKPSPSEIEGLDFETEMKMRIIGCETIEDAGKLLKLPQVAIASAEVLYNRFYFSKSFIKHNWEHYSMACVFLSAKIEESCRRLRDVVNVFVHLRQLREQKILKTLSLIEYSELKPHIIKAERRILKELGFCVHGKHPHKLICIFMHILNQTDNPSLIQLSWNYMNDSLRTSAFVSYEPEAITCACIYLAARHLQLALGTNWFEIFGYSEELIQAICTIILKLYSMDKPDLTKLESEVLKLRQSQIEARNKRIADEKTNQFNIMKKDETERKDHRDLVPKKDKKERSSSQKRKIRKRSHSSSHKHESRNRSRSRRKEKAPSKERKGHKRESDKKYKHSDEGMDKRQNVFSKQKRYRHRSVSRDSITPDKKILKKHNPHIIDKSSKLSTNKRYNGNVY